MSNLNDPVSIGLNFASCASQDSSKRPYSSLLKYIITVKLNYCIRNRGGSTEKLVGRCRSEMGAQAYAKNNATMSTSASFPVCNCTCAIVGVVCK